MKIFDWSESSSLNSCRDGQECDEAPKCGAFGCGSCSRGRRTSLAAGVSSNAQTTPSAASDVADARGDTPREDDPSLAVDYECESDDMADSGRLDQSPDYLQAADYEPSNERAHSVIHATDM